jgi:hypothetical protein
MELYSDPNELRPHHPTDSLRFTFALLFHLRLGFQNGFPSWNFQKKIFMRCHLPEYINFPPYLIRLELVTITLTIFRSEYRLRRPSPHCVTLCILNACKSRFLIQEARKELLCPKTLTIRAHVAKIPSAQYTMTHNTSFYITLISF